jgi:GntR family transcriptional regulator, transcriptional repressor for pyruvate dehydrogenase complex
MFDPLKKVTICDMVVQDIIAKIKTGDLKIGDRLPSERELAERLEVSRISVREGIKILSSMGFLDVRVGDGTFVRKIDVSKAMEPLTYSLYLESSALLELLESRKIIEVAIAGLAAERATEDELELLKSTVDQMAKSFSDADSFRESDADFHIALAEMAHNIVLHRVVITVRDMLKVSSKATYQVPGACEKALKFHQGIFEAIVAKNSSKAKEIMLKHLEDVEHDLLLIHQPVHSEGQ